MKRSFQTRTLLAGMLGTAIFAGCVSQEPPPPPPPPPPVPASAATLESVRSSLVASFPNVKVAAVGEVLPDAPYLSTLDLNVADFPLETIVSILDERGQPVGHGSVVKLVENQAHIRFDTSRGATRRPQLGDIVVAGLTVN